MKHWIEFFPNKTREQQKIGKMAIAFDYELWEKELLYKSAISNCNKIEKEIIKDIGKNNTDFNSLNALIAAAKEKANQWNATPTNELKNPNKKK
jgi:hypothetical protein